MLDTIFFDVGNTLRIVVKDKEFSDAAERELMKLVGATEPNDVFYEKLLDAPQLEDFFDIRVGVAPDRRKFPNFDGVVADFAAADEKPPLPQLADEFCDGG